MNQLRSAALAISVCIGGAAATVSAQGGVEAEDAGQQDEGEAPAEGSPLAQANGIVRQGRALSERLQGLLNDARKEGDIIKVTCLNDKLTQTNANLRQVKQRVKSMKEAAARNDTGAANHEFTVLTVLQKKLEVLGQQASQCVGQGLFEPGSAQVVTTVDDSTVPTFVDPTDIGAPPSLPPSVSLPPPASGAI